MYLCNPWKFCSYICFVSILRMCVCMWRGPLVDLIDRLTLTNDSELFFVVVEYKYFSRGIAMRLLLMCARNEQIKSTRMKSEIYMAKNWWQETLICNLIHYIMPIIIYQTIQRQCVHLSLYLGIIVSSLRVCVNLCMRAFAICVRAALFQRNSQMTANKHVCYLLLTELPKAQHYAIDHVVDVNCIHMVIVSVCMSVWGELEKMKQRNGEIIMKFRFVATYTLTSDAWI